MNALPVGGSIWLRRAQRLVGATMAWNVLEAGVALWAGVRAQSIALVGFGLDSVIECVAAGVVLWRLRVEAKGAAADVVERSERRVVRVVGVTFLLLAVYVTAEAGTMLAMQEPPEESLAGMVLAAASLVIMPLVSWGKLRAARELSSASLRAEAKETLACAWLSLALLVGLMAHTALGWWWADPAVALLMVPWLLREGWEALRGECGCT